MRASVSGESVTGSLSVMGQQVSVAATAPPPDPSVAVERKDANDAAAAKKAMDDVAASMKAEVGSDSSSVPAVGSKRATAPSGSTPSAKRSFLSSWKPRPVAQVCSCYFFYCSCNLSD
jgi:hypothetical protein